SSLFFFQAEDGIRDRNVTGVQTCALPIYVLKSPTPARIPAAEEEPSALIEGVTAAIDDARRLAAPTRRIVTLELDRQRFYTVSRSEERRVGKECRFRGARDD